ncbi:MAG: OB-fold domain-containing protein [Rubrivivax sp.]|nr:OB-fold domain-containing protein [Rubrivivax sp.]
MNKPSITVTETSAPFWQGVKDKRLLLQYDPLARRHQFFPRPISLQGTGALEWRASRGEGKLVAFTETHFPAPGFKTPYLEALIQLDEGPRLFTTVVGVVYADLRIGMRMRIVWPDASESSDPFQFTPCQETS